MLAQKYLKVVTIERAFFGYYDILSISDWHKCLNCRRLARCHT